MSIDGVFFIALEHIERAAEILDHIAGALRLSLRGSDESLVHLQHMIGPKSVFIVLDHFEHVIKVAHWLPSLLIACPNLRLLVTSNERLNLEAEWVLNLTRVTHVGHDA